MTKSLNCLYVKAECQILDLRLYLQDRLGKRRGYLSTFPPMYQKRSFHLIEE